MLDTKNKVLAKFIIMIHFSDVLRRGVLFVGQQCGTLAESAACRGIVTRMSQNVTAVSHVTEVSLDVSFLAGT